MTKSNLRKKLLQKVASIPAQQKQQLSEDVCKNLLSIASIVNSSSIFTYMPMPDEVDIRPAITSWINNSITVSIPIVYWEEKTMRCGLITSLEDDNLVDSKYGILEPAVKHTISNDCIETILVPGVGFDAAGGRLGRGGGFYDRFLSSSRPPIVIGVCFDEQIIEQVPCEIHDQLMTAVVTPTNVFLD